jgi:hypothetical protein
MASLFCKAFQERHPNRATRTRAFQDKGRKVRSSIRSLAQRFCNAASLVRLVEILPCAGAAETNEDQNQPRKGRLNLTMNHAVRWGWVVSTTGIEPGPQPCQGNPEHEFSRKIKAKRPVDVQTE